LLTLGLPEQRIEGRPMPALDALLELRVDGTSAINLVPSDRALNC
jgi:hypothetical protein